MQEQIFRKSWVTYLFPSLRFLLGVHFTYLSLPGILVANRAASENGLIYIVLLIGFVLSVQAGFRLLWLFTFKMRVRENNLEIAYGVLPWNKIKTYFDQRRLHEVLYINTGFINWATRSGTVILVGSEGDTDRIFFAGMAQPKTIAQSITDNIVYWQGNENADIAQASGE